MLTNITVSDRINSGADVVLYEGDCLELLKKLPAGTANLVVTSPPYNIGKPYENRLELGTYVGQQKKVITECVRILSKSGSICWQIGNFVKNGEIIPLDILLWPVFQSLGLKLRNRIIWHFGHGLHCSKRFSGRYETILWFTKSDKYVFNLDAVRVPAKYPEKKYFKGPKKGQLSGNPLGKNPSDVWDIPNVKCNHPEKTGHPCQFPVELIERLVLALTKPGDLVVDPFMGVGSTAIAAVLHRRKAAGAEVVSEYVKITKDRLKQLNRGRLRIRPMGKPIYEPPKKKFIPSFLEQSSSQMGLSE
jgi:adenine-specific DNA-methyltransferase